MQAKMKRPIKKAGVGTLAIGNELHNKLYRKAARLSNLKLQLGEFLLLLHAPLKKYEGEVCLHVFEAVLNEFLNLKYGRAQK